LVQNDGVLIAFSQPSDERIRLCRQVCDIIIFLALLSISIAATCTARSIIPAATPLRIIGLLCIMAPAQPTQATRGAVVHVSTFTAR
jgi:hypothetical protein